MGITPVQDVADLYGIQSDNPEQSMYDWAVDHGFLEALIINLNTPMDDTPGPFYGSWTVQKHTLREDGSSVMTIVGPAAENDIYDLEYNIIPLNMEDQGNSFLTGPHDSGLISLTLTDSAPHIPEIKVSAIKRTFNLTEEEYSRKAWGLYSSEDYAYLINNIDSRNGQAYCIKGAVQEILSVSPLRVLINVSEDGTSLPVVVESPSYCTFAWKTGNTYTIFADVSYLDNNIPVLTARFSHTYPLESKQINEQEDIEFKRATVTIRKAVTDGTAVYLSVEVQPNDDNCLALASSILPTVDTPEAVGKASDYEGQTLCQWAVEHGYQLLNFDVKPLLDKFYHPFTVTGTKSTENGAALINLVSGTVPDTDQYPILLSLGLYNLDTPNALPTYKYAEKDISLSLSPANEIPETLAEYISVADPTDINTEGAITVSIFRTSLNVYCKLNRPEDNGAAVCYCILFTADDRMDGSFKNINTYYIPAADNQNCIMIPETALSDEMLENLPDTFKYILATIPENDEKLSTACYTLKKLNEAKADTAAVKVIETAADSDNVCLTVEITPRSPRILVVNFDVEPFADSPVKIGQVPESRTQTISEWAVLHGYQAIIRATLSSSVPENYVYSSPASAEAGLDSFSNGTELTEKHSTILRAVGKTIPGLEIYDLFCNLMYWDLSDKNSGQQEQVFFPVHVSAGAEEPELIGEYRLASDPDNADQMTVSVFRTPVSDYAVFRTDDRDYFFRNVRLLDESGNPDVFNGKIFLNTSQEYEDENTYIYRLPCKLPEELPDTLIMSWSDRADETIIRVDNRVADPVQAVNP